MSQYIVASSGYVITRRKVISLRTLEFYSYIEKRKRKIFDYSIQKNLRNSVIIPTSPKARDYTPYSDGDNPYSVQFPKDNNPVMPDCNAVFENLIAHQWIRA